MAAALLACILIAGLHAPAILLPATAGFVTGMIPGMLGLYLMQRHLHKAIRAQKQFVRSLIDVLPVPVYVKDAACRYIYVNRAVAEEQQQPPEAMLGRTAAQIAHNRADGERSGKEDLAVLEGAQVHIERHDIHPVWGQERHRVIMKGRCFGPNGEPLVVGANFDITRWWTGERELLQAKQNLQTALNNEVASRQRTEAFIQRLIDVIPDPVFIKKTGGVYVMVNDAFARYRNIDKLTFKGFKNDVAAQNAALHVTSMTEDEQVLAGAEITKEDHTIRQSTGEEVFRIISKRRSIFVDGDPVIVGVEHHITEWRLAERELKRLAEEDALTGIANRRHFSREAERAIERAHRYNEKLSLLMLDIDFFKRINDSHGHNVGDEVLCEMARRMQACLRKTDLPGRWGGEEFVALLPHTMLDTALKVAERLHAEFMEQPVKTSAGALPVTFSGGSAQLLPGDSLHSLVARADAALYRAKNGGRNRIEIAQAEEETEEEPAGVHALNIAQNPAA